MSKIVCTACGYVGEPTTATKGSFGVELVLWLCLIIPGLIYSIWRLSSRHDACRILRTDRANPYGLTHGGQVSS